MDFPVIDIGIVTGPPTPAGLYPIRLFSGRELIAPQGAKHAIPHENMSSLIKPLTRVLVATAPDGQFYIIALIHDVVDGEASVTSFDTEVAAGGTGSQTREPTTGAGYGVLGSGIVFMESSAFARLMTIPGLDAVRAVARRFNVEASSGYLSFHQDDLTTRTTIQMAGRSSSVAGVDTITSMIQLGYHSFDPTVVASITIYPPIPDVTPPDISGLAKLKPKFGGWWNGKERKDFVTRISFTFTGDTIYESGIPIPKTATIPTVKIKLKATGTVDITVLKDISSTALTQHLRALETISLTASKIAMVAASSISMDSISTAITALEKVDISSTAINLTAPGLQDLLKPLVKEILYTYVATEDFQWKLTHIHSNGNGGSPTGPPIQPPPTPPSADEAVTLIVKAV